MPGTFTPYLDDLDGEPTSVPAGGDAYLRVRVTGAPRRDGSMLVYLPDGTAIVVNSRHLLRLDGDERGRTGPG